ncbi:TonB-dependent receptor [Tenacibaculum sp. M341]|uniref:TonB-dependent receptor n=1 Tax=Tenacibaculum sp. M341 TaxID=2530339 RepID=UPI00104386BC|nr:TonB-dependent receptor plug domain-containing protein [Tenacibaculum sp. M341]TCI94318.1 TonB-dependent receptor [Tenacibaculum sp. M341]
MRYYFFLFSVMIFVSISAQVNIKIHVKDSLHSPVKDAYVLLNSKPKLTGQNGGVSFVVKKGTYQLSVNHIAYETFSKKLVVDKDLVFSVELNDNKELLQEVVVTAKESDNITSTSVIDKRAMSHLQPSSFSDLMSLLPGNNVGAPVLTSANNLLLRETGVGDPDGNYTTSSLGISFLVDGMPINTNANLQQTIGSSFAINPIGGQVDQSRRTVRTGVDMRAISTDDIETVEVVRGVASAKYGDLSSGLIRIKRKNGETRWNARVKSDGFSKLFYLGKGYYFDKSNLGFNFNLGYLDAKSDPRNELENYERITASVRLQKTFETVHPLTWNLNIDYTGTVDGEETDPDIGIENLDKYKSSYSNVRLSNELNMDFSEGFLRNLNFKVNVNSSNDRIEQTRWRQLTSATSLSVNTEEGEGYGIFLEPSYLSHIIIDGKPLDIFSDLSSVFEFNTFSVKNKLSAGFNYSYSKNNGLGQIYDITRPPTSTGFILARPRAFKDIPAMQNVAFYVEDIMSWSLNKTIFTLRAGVRGNSIVGLDDNYEINGKLFVNPRLNLKVDLPKINFSKGRALAVNITAGYGKQHKLPTQNMLFPQDRVVDFEQLNYFHPNEEFRRVHYQTYIFPQVNYRIKPALNTKKEIRLGLNYDYHSLYVTYFDEKMSSGFRNVSQKHNATYKVYDTSGLDPNIITEAPAVENLPFTEVDAQILTAQESNGSAIYKRGIEFQYTGKRFKGINTRFTITGAWFKTEYTNSLPFLAFAENRTINGVFHSNIGVYQDDDSFLKEALQTSITADTYFQKLGLTTSFRTDVNWYATSLSSDKSRVPFQYINEAGEVFPYTDVEANDPILQSLIRAATGSNNNLRRTPLALSAHLKISKKFYKNFTVSMYMNNLFNYFEINDIDDELAGQRQFVDPYFGMEMNVKF